jgi:hypothetical protein
MRTMGADGKLELEKELVRRIADGILRSPVLAAHLTELARPYVSSSDCPESSAVSSSACADLS